MQSKGSGGKRSGAGRKSKDEDEKSVRATFQINNGIWKYFCSLKEPAERHELIQNWIRIYSIAGGESDSFLAQSPLAVELLSYLEATDAPADLRDKLESLIVARDSDEVRIAEGVVKVGNSYVV